MKWERQMFYQAVGEAWTELVDAYKWRLRWWWRYKILRRPRPEPGSSSGYFQHTLDELFSLSPTDIPFTKMVMIDDPYKITHHPPGTDLTDIEPQTYIWEEQ